MNRTLSEVEVALVHRWARRQRLWFFLITPLALFTGLSLIAIGVVELLALHLWAIMALCGGGGLLFIMGLWFVSTRRFAEASVATRVEPLSGVLNVKAAGRTQVLRIGSTPVAFATAAMRRQLKLDETCHVEVVSGQPALVVAVKT